MKWAAGMPSAQNIASGFVLKATGSNTAAWGVPYNAIDLNWYDDSTNLWHIGGDIETALYQWASLGIPVRLYEDSDYNHHNPWTVKGVYNAEYEDDSGYYVYYLAVQRLGASHVMEEKLYKAAYDDDYGEYCLQEIT